MKTTLSDIDTRKIHFVKVPENHVVIDFDLKDQNGHKALERNLEAASHWPATYAEISRSGSGIHLHYIYEGDDVGDSAPVFADGIEVKVYSGDAALRRKLSRCNAGARGKDQLGVAAPREKGQDAQGQNDSE